MDSRRRATGNGCASCLKGGCYLDTIAFSNGKCVFVSRRSWKRRLYLHIGIGIIYLKAGGMINDKTDIPSPWLIGRNCFLSRFNMLSERKSERQYMGNAAVIIRWQPWSVNIFAQLRLRHFTWRWQSLAGCGPGRISVLMAQQAKCHRHWQLWKCWIFAGQVPEFVT